MKNFLKLITLIFLTLLAFNKNSFSCDNLKNVKVGEDFSKSLEIADKDTLIVIHRNKKFNENFTENFKIQREKTYGLSKIIFGKLLF